jgi:hypothetical protein
LESDHLAREIKQNFMTLLGNIDFEKKKGPDEDEKQGQKKGKLKTDKKKKF